VTFKNQPANTFLNITQLPVEDFPDLAFPVVEIVLLDDKGGEVPVDDPSNEISFFFPLLPTTLSPTPLATRTTTEALGACIDGQLLQDELSCQWLVEGATDSWSSKGCVLTYVDPSSNSLQASHKCTCSHLTVFTIRSRRVEVKGAFGLSGSGLYASVFVSLALLVSLGLVVQHWRRFPDSQPLSMVYLVAGWVGFGSDMLFWRYLKQASLGCGEAGELLLPYANGVFAVTMVAILFNVVYNAWFMLVEANSNLSISRWMSSHKLQAALIYFLALPSPSIMNLLGSRLFGSQADFPALEEQDGERFPRLTKLSLLNMIFEDVPQLIIGVAMAFQFGAFGTLMQYVVALKCVYITFCVFKATFTAAWHKLRTMAKKLVRSCAKVKISCFFFF
jgi:hypothetical protein